MTELTLDSLNVIAYIKQGGKLLPVYDSLGTAQQTFPSTEHNPLPEIETFSIKRGEPEIINGDFHENPPPPNPTPPPPPPSGTLRNCSSCGRPTPRFAKKSPLLCKSCYNREREGTKVECTNCHQPKLLATKNPPLCRTCYYSLKKNSKVKLNSSGGPPARSSAVSPALKEESGKEVPLRFSRKCVQCLHEVNCSKAQLDDPYFLCPECKSKK
jgi:hypothetical protein